VSRQRPSTRIFLLDFLLRNSLIPNEFRAARRGMWELGTSAETPAEYKRRHTQTTAAGEATKSVKQEKTKAQTSSVGWLRRLWGPD